LHSNLGAARQEVRSFFGPIQCGGLSIVDSKQVTSEINKI